MLLELEKELFDADTAEPMPILEILQFTVKGRHDWRPEPEVAMTAIDYLEANLPRAVNWREFLYNASKAGAWQAADERPHVTVTAGNLQHMVGDLGLPAYLVVENGQNDGSFLWAVFSAYAPELCAAVLNNWLDIVHTGGTGEEPPVTRAQAKKFRAVCRVLVIKDNDLKQDISLGEGLTDPWPPAEPIRHMWLRHEVENYLPDAVLRLSRNPNVEKLIDHLRSMTQEQQRWIDIKKGVSHGPKYLFEDLDRQIRTLWSQGFGKTFPKPLVPGDVVLTEEDFRRLGEDVHEELMYLLRKIRLLV